MKRILIVDKDRKAAEQLALRLRTCEPELSSATADTPDGAAMIAAELGVGFVFIDLVADPPAGVEAARRIVRSCMGHVPVLVGLAADEACVREAVEEQLFDRTLRKPVRVAGLLALIAGTDAQRAEPERGSPLGHALGA